MTKLTVATEIPSGARSVGYQIEEKVAFKWFESVLRQMRAFDMTGSSVILLDGDKEISREAV
jgi:hypothetical protein